MTFPLALLFADASGAQTVLSMHAVDFVIIGVYFVVVLAIGFYLKRYTTSSEDFFMAGREMTAWVAGLSFICANLGALELMGWAASAYQYGILAAHYYWCGAIPAMLFLGVVMMPFYYICKTHSVPGYLQLRFGEPTRLVGALSFVFLTILMSGINMYAMAVVMKVMLGWDIHLSIWISSITVAVYVAMGGLVSAIFNEVLQFFLIWLGALMIPILGMVEAGGWSKLVARIHQNFPQGDYTHLWRPMAHFADNPMGIHWTGIVFGLLMGSLGYWTTDFLVVQRALAAKDLRSAKLAPIIGSYFKMAVPLIVVLPGLLALGVLPFKLVPESAVGPRPAQLQRSAAAHAGALLRAGLAGAGHHGADRRVHVGHGGQRQRVCHRVDVRSLPAVPSQDRHRRPLRFHGPLVHDSGSGHQHRHGIPGDAIRQHHGLRTGRLQLLYHPAVCHGLYRHDVEARHPCGRILGLAGGDALLPGHVAAG